MLSLCSAWMLTFNISGDATPPKSDIFNLGDLYCCRPIVLVVIVLFVLLQLEKRASHNIWGVTALLETTYRPP